MSANYLKTLTLAAIAAAFPSVSAAPLNSGDQSVINNLANSSGVVAGQINLGNTFTRNIGGIAAQGNLVASDAHIAAMIDDQMQAAYNNAMQAFSGHGFYTAKDHLDELATEASANLDTAVDTYTEAAVALQTVVTVNQMASAVVNTDQAEVMQDYVATSGADQGITDQMQGDYNDSLAGVTTAAREFATYKSAAVDSHLVAHMDDFAAAYNVDMADAFTTLDLVGGYINTTYQTPGNEYSNTLTHSLYFTTAYETAGIYE